MKRNKTNLQATTYDGYAHMINKHIAPHFNVNIRSIKPMHIQEYMNEKLESGLSANTVGKHYALIKEILKDAVINDIIKVNPADKIKKPKKSKIRYCFYTAEQLRTLMNVIQNTDIELPVMLAVFLDLEGVRYWR